MEEMTLTTSCRFLTIAGHLLESFPIFFLQKIISHYKINYDWPTGTGVPEDGGSQLLL